MCNVAVFGRVMQAIFGVSRPVLSDGTAHLLCDTVEIHGTLHGRDFTTSDDAVVMKFEKKKRQEGITTTEK